MRRRLAFRSPTTVLWPISIRPCRNWRGNSTRSSVDDIVILSFRWWFHAAVRRKSAKTKRKLTEFEVESRTSHRLEKNMVVKIQNVGVIGAGQMGNGIAHVCALAGYTVLLNDLSADRIKAGLATINGNMAKQVGKKAITEDDRKSALSRIKPAEMYDALSSCDLVIETATEKEEVKRKIFSDLCASLKSEAILATNTSSISITRLASSTDRPERFIGIHFMNPVPLMELVELIRGIATDEATFETSKAFISKLGKTIAVSEDFPAFIVNRILLPM